MVCVYVLVLVKCSVQNVLLRNVPEIYDRETRAPLYGSALVEMTWPFCKCVFHVEFFTPYSLYLSSSV